ncbi:hypothetical protein AUEXF2481DRAFT_118127 [Aureobasidium subglaciale EXF-2481]|uniref:Uncharacterized protein n=1 Tax=Aureobasidium subglaciale (strain EXF-2481) TaxID=1043005 RepID=A0A074YVF9_AURSE|nr:uncharacterized protein AUEXF2481DRAFT_118127 [Aureobasidium subglaciale EXF-2481]KER00120.1 hypothetical protein AUEXF2481DRAFT_118127 [Aureobasidium subglaciale EXF-2481]
MTLSREQLHLGSTSLSSPIRQLCFLSTGCLAGFASLPMAFLPKLPSISAATPLVLRAGIRFWTFDQTRHLLAPLHLPVWLIGGLGGAAGGFNEVLLHSLVQSRKLPSATALGAQTLRLFLCFGTFTYLSTSFSDTLPPKPFWKCWLMGATAGATGSAIVAALEGTSGTALWGRAIPRGAATIGTVIAVHVTSCAKLIEVVDAGD